MNTTTPSISKPDAVTLISICAMQSDAKIKPIELRTLAMLVTVSPLHRHIKDPVAYLSGLNQTFSGMGVETVIDQSIETLSPRLRETAYAWACEIVMADLGVSQEEHACLGLLVKKMGLHGELAGKIAAVVAILNRKE